MATTKTDCEAYMRALEEQSDAIKGAAEGMMAAINTFKDSVESVLRTVDNLKRMIEMTRQAMVLAHGDKVVERVEIQREEEPVEEEDGWIHPGHSLLHLRTGMQNWMNPDTLTCLPTGR